MVNRNNYSKVLVYICMFLCMGSLACSDSNQRKIKQTEACVWRAHLDSAVNYYQKGMILNDSLCINKALVFLDDVANNDTIKAQLRQCHMLKSQIYIYQKNYKEALPELIAYIEMLPEDNIERLIFLGLLSKQEGQKRDSELYFNRVMLLCDSILEKK